jgi:hypothetical protein
LVNLFPFFFLFFLSSLSSFTRVLHFMLAGKEYAWFNLSMKSHAAPCLSYVHATSCRFLLCAAVFRRLFSSTVDFSSSRGCFTSVNKWIVNSLAYSVAVLFFSRVAHVRSASFPRTDNSPLAMQCSLNKWIVLLRLLFFELLFPNFQVPFWGLIYVGFLCILYGINPCNFSLRKIKK